MRASLWLAVLLSFVVAGCGEPPPDAPPADEVAEDDSPGPADAEPLAEAGPLGCVLTAEPTGVVGRPHRIAVRLLNRTDAEILLVGCLDGSSWGKRFPHCRYEVTGPDGRPRSLRLVGCGNVNGLRADDFVAVPPRGEFDPFDPIPGRGSFGTDELGGGLFDIPGKYRIQFVYSTAATEIGRWFGNAADPAIVALLARVPKVEVRSNVLELTVVPAGK
jgi:hypothetical protein